MVYLNKMILINMTFAYDTMYRNIFLRLSSDGKKQMFCFSNNKTRSTLYRLAIRYPMLGTIVHLSTLIRLNKKTLKSYGVKVKLKNQSFLCNKTQIIKT